MAKGGDPSPVQPLYVGGNAYCGVPVAEQERDVVHIDAPLTIAVEESDAESMARGDADPRAGKYVTVATARAFLRRR